MSRQTLSEQAQAFEEAWNNSEGVADAELRNLLAIAKQIQQLTPADMPGIPPTPPAKPSLAKEIGLMFSTRRIATTIAVAVTALILFTGPGQAFAQSVLRKFGLIEVVEHPSIPYAQPDTDSPPTASPIPFVPETEADVETLVGFDVVTPSYVPDGFALFTRSVAPPPTGQRVATIYQRTDGTPGHIQFDQFQFHSDDKTYEWGVQTGTASPITVRGQSGLWVDDPENTLYPTTLFWEEGGYTFVIHTPGLSQTEVVRMAESFALK